MSFLRCSDSTIAHHAASILKLRKRHLTPARHFRRPPVPISTNQTGPRGTANRRGDWRPTVSQTASADRRGFVPLTIEEQKIYRKWRRITLAGYGVLAIFLTALAIAIGPPDPTTAKHNAAYSAIASAGQNKPR
jgi:hypothetical protein